MYEKIKRDGFSDQKAYMGNVTFTAGNNQFIYSYQKAKDGGLNGSTGEVGCDVNALGYKYNFSRRTFFLAQYVKVDNNVAGTCNFGVSSGALTIAAGQDPHGIAVGMFHNF